MQVNRSKKSSGILKALRPDDQHIVNCCRFNLHREHSYRLAANLKSGRNRSVDWMARPDQPKPTNPLIVVKSRTSLVRCALSERCKKAPTQASCVLRRRATAFLALASGADPNRFLGDRSAPRRQKLSILKERRSGCLFVRLRNELFACEAPIAGRLPPVSPVEVPAYGFAETICERVCRTPA